MINKLLAILFLATAAHAQISNLGRIDVRDKSTSEGTWQPKTNSRSSQIIDKKDIDRQNYTDINRLIKNVAGTTVQEEDGMGLRPNIGMRGVHPNRSKKIAIHEDGILIGPAPYSAPAAYYFPLTNKIDSIEINKGVDGVLDGPNSVGGSVNMLTRQIPQKKQGEIQAETGIVQRYRFSQGNRVGPVGYIIDLHHLESKGFKKLTNGDPTGFGKNDLSGKVSYEFKKHQFTAKGTYANENSYETYLGLSSQDISRDPYLRYSASQDDQMKWDQRQFQLFHDYEIARNLKLSNKAYYHNFDRNWVRLDNIQGLKDSGQTLFDLLNNAQDPANQGYMNMLRGTSNTSSPFGDDKLLVAHNQRSFLSRGFQSSLSGKVATKVGLHNWTLSARLHRDYIRRHHTQEKMKMVDNQRISAGDETTLTADNKDQTDAVTLTANDQISFDNFMLGLNLRYESLSQQSDDYQTGRTNKQSGQFFIPGVKGTYQLTDNWSLYSGVNKGITLPTPTIDNTSVTEKSVNYEAGWEYNQDVTWKTSAFFTNYQNLTGICSAGEGCLNNATDKAYNGGKAKIMGLETTLKGTLNKGQWNFPMALSYTFIQARFAGDTMSSNNEWGIGQIRKGDPLPYVPAQQYTFNAGVDYKKFGSTLTFNWMDKLYDQSVQENRHLVQSYGIIDWSMNYRYSSTGSIYFKADNLLKNDYVVSYRPFGARPGKPQMFSVGLKQLF